MRTEQNHPYTPILDGMIICNRCNTEMRLINTQYHCPNTQNLSCTNKLIETEQTAEIVVSHLLQDYIVPKVLQRISEQCEREFKEPRRLQKEAIRKYEAAISAIKTRRAEFLQSVERLHTTYHQAEEHIHRTNCTETRLQFQCAVAEKELSMMDAMADIQIHNPRASPQNFIEKNDPKVIRRHLEKFIDSIQVNDNVPTIIYHKSAIS